MRENITDILAELKAEKDAQDDAIKRAIQEEIFRNPIKLENLDDKLKHLIMTKQGETQGNAPVPKNPMSGADTKDKVDSKIVINDTFQKVCDDLLVKNNVYLYGKAGTGKTVLAKSVAKYLLGDDTTLERMYQKDKKTANGDKVPVYYILNCSQWTSPAQIIGGFNIRGYSEGQLELAWRYGAVLILDELPKLDPNTAGLLNDALSMAAEEGASLTNGRGESFPKHPNFGVVGAGNTDMKTVGASFTGNNRQDYSLVDRFTGSFYKIEEDLSLEYRLTYRAVFSIAQGLRQFLKKDENSIEAITIRSMLNFNRIYQLQMLRLTRSPLLMLPAGVTEEDAKKGIKEGKTLEDSINSFINSLGTDRQIALRRDAKFQSIESQNVVDLETILIEAVESITEFREDFTRLTNCDSKTGLNLKTGKKCN